MATYRDNFLALDPPHCDYDSAHVAVLPIPYDATTSYAPGAREGPRAIITASQQVELYDDELQRESHTLGIATLDPVATDARGPAESLALIRSAADRPIADDKFLLSLGGEHSVSAPLVAAVRERHPKLSVLQIDAHADLRDTYQNAPHSHACVMRRIHEQNCPIVPVGVRNLAREEADYARDHNLPLYTPRDCRQNPDWISRVIEQLTDEVYVTVDIDGFDPAYAPGTGTPEPGGLDWFQVTDLLAAVAAHRRIVSADIVEVRPIPPNHVTEFLAARLAYRIIGLAAPDSYA